MSGRAGRPQHDVLGESIIITSHRELHWSDTEATQDSEAELGG